MTVMVMCGRGYDLGCREVAKLPVYIGCLWWEEVRVEGEEENTNQAEIGIVGKKCWGW